MIMYEFYLKFKMFRCNVIHNYPLALVKLFLDQGNPGLSHTPLPSNGVYATDSSTVRTSASLRACSLSFQNTPTPSRPSIKQPPFATLFLRHPAPVLSEHPERIRGEAMKRRHVDRRRLQRHTVTTPREVQKQARWAGPGMRSPELEPRTGARDGSSPHYFVKNRFT